MRFIKKYIAKIYHNYIWLLPFNFIERKINSYKSNNQPEIIGWSFIIITNGLQNDILQDSINSILYNFRNESEFEIIIMGPLDLVDELKGQNLILYNYKSLKFLPGYITLKKNIGVKISKYDKCVVLHDYVKFDDKWLDGYEKFGYNFDVCINKINLLNGQRTRDWMVWDYPNIGTAMLPYDKNVNNYQYINGTYFICKRQFFLNNQLNENLRWGFGEDVEWSKRVRYKTNIKLNTFSTVSYLKEKKMPDAPYETGWIERTINLSDMLQSTEGLEEIIKHETIKNY